MVWGDQDGKDNKKKTNPWGKKPDSGVSGKEFDDFFKKEAFSGFKGPFSDNSQKADMKPPSASALIGLAALAFFVWLASGFYIIEEEEQAVVLRFGEFVRIANPGPNYHLPTPIEKIIKLKVTRIEREEIGYRGGQESSNTARSGRNIPEESLMLTGDENIVDINFVVQWKINNIKNYVFNIVGPRETVKSAAESSMREVIGKTPISDAQTQGRSLVEQSAKKLLQDILDSYAAGIEIVGLQMLKVDPPSEVVDAFRDVQTARADKEREINQAEAYQNDIIPRARGDAEQILQNAEAYKQEVIASSQGHASRFLAVYNEYKKAKDVTRQRIYLETMEDILKDMNKILVDSGKTQGVLPYLPLSELNKNRTPTPSKQEKNDE